MVTIIRQVAVRQVSGGWLVGASGYLPMERRAKKKEELLLVRPSVQLLLLKRYDCCGRARGHDFYCTWELYTAPTANIICMAELTIKGTLLAVDKEDLFRISITLIIIIFQSALANFGPTACSSAKSPRDIFTERERERRPSRMWRCAALSLFVQGEAQFIGRRRDRGQIIRWNMLSDDK
jgi:hypothetical protein